MAGLYDKKEEQKITVNDVPQGSTASAENVSEETPTGIDKAEQLYKGLGDSLGKQYEADQKVIEEREKAVEEQKKKRDEAIQNGTSLVLNMLKESKPEYDEAKAKRLRNRAIVQSLGDMLSAVAMGAHAYGKKGAGYVPKMAESGHMQSLAEVDKMRDEYLKRGEEWKNLELNWKKAQADAKIAAEEKLLTEEEAKLATAKSKAEATRKAQADLLNTWKEKVADYYMDMDKEKGKAANAQERDKRNHEYRMEEAVVKEESKADSKDPNTKMTDEEKALREFAYGLYGDEAYGKSYKVTTKKEKRKDVMGNVIGYDDVPTTTEEKLSWDDLGSPARADKYTEWRKDATIKQMMDVYNTLIKKGLTPERAKERVLDNVQ